MDDHGSVLEGPPSSFLSSLSSCRILGDGRLLAFMRIGLELFVDCRLIAICTKVVLIMTWLPRRSAEAHTAISSRPENVLSGASENPKTVLKSRQSTAGKHQVDPQVLMCGPEHSWAALGARSGALWTLFGRPQDNPGPFCRALGRCCGALGATFGISAYEWVKLLDIATKRRIGPRRLARSLVMHSMRPRGPPNRAKPLKLPFRRSRSSLQVESRYSGCNFGRLSKHVAVWHTRVKKQNTVD